jgi:hypothetical protein
VDYTQTSWKEEQHNNGNSDGPPEETNNQGESSSEISGLDETLEPPDSIGKTITVVVQERAVSRPKKAKAVATSASKAPTEHHLKHQTNRSHSQRQLNCRKKETSGRERRNWQIQNRYEGYDVLLEESNYIENVESLLPTKFERWSPSKSCWLD